MESKYEILVKPVTIHEKSKKITHNGLITTIGENKKAICSFYGETLEEANKIGNHILFLLNKNPFL